MLIFCFSLGFSGCFVVQDHVAATFGSGLATACVVDVGKDDNNNWNSFEFRISMVKFDSSHDLSVKTVQL